ncbi:hypothetical protein SDJN02_01243, partial [Cucurbita argyrosperma subsp. argyrosperma]
MAGSFSRAFPPTSIEAASPPLPESCPLVYPSISTSVLPRQRLFSDRVRKMIERWRKMAAEGIEMTEDLTRNGLVLLMLRCAKNYRRN